MIVHYSAEDSEIYELEVSDGSWIHRPREQQEIIELCAEDYHGNHDGWESRWPLEFRLHDPETKEVIATLTVDIEHEPVFTATHVKKPEKPAA